MWYDRSVGRPPDAILLIGTTLFILSFLLAPMGIIASIGSALKDESRTLSVANALIAFLLGAWAWNLL